MVLPLIGALAGAGGSIAAALIGGQAQDQATRYNWMANLYNLQQRDKEQQKAYDYADEIRAEQKLGATDALGNKTYFDEEKGWVSELAPEQQELYDYFIGQELPELRSQFRRDASRRRVDDDQANALLEQFRRIYRSSPKEVEALLYEVANRGISESARDTTETAMRQALRTGNSNTGDLLNKIGQATMEQRRRARTDARLQSKDYVDQKYASERAGVSGLYNLFANRAGQGLRPSFDPSNTAQAANSLMNVFSNQAQQGNSIGANASMMKGGTLNDVQPALGSANAAGAIGSALSGLGDRMGSYNDKSEMNELLKMYMSNNGQISIDQGGILAMLTDRNNKSSDLW